MSKWHFVIIEHLSQKWFSHFGQDQFTANKGGIFDNNHSELYGLMKPHFKEPVVMREIRVTEFQMDRPEMWFKISFFVCGQGS